MYCYDLIVIRFKKNGDKNSFLMRSYEFEMHQVLGFLQNFEHVGIFSYSIIHLILNIIMFLVLNIILIVVTCSTPTVTKCQAALRTLQSFPFFKPTCLCKVNLCKYLQYKSNVNKFQCCVAGATA